MSEFRNAIKLLAEELSRTKEDKKKKEEMVGDKPSVTHHVIELEDGPFRYKATAGYLHMKDEHQKLKARCFFISYEKEGLKDTKDRPVTFAFNGGPGAASAWVHFGAMGPKRIVTTDNGEILPAPYRYEDNMETWLEFTDLVFMDPVGTGFSWHEKDEDPKQFFGVEEDLQAGGDFIRLWVTKNQRWLSPKYVAGESYGTFRGAGLANYLQGRHAMDFNGIIMISSVLNFLTFSFATGNDTPYVLYLPAYTATAHYHGKLPAHLQSRDLEDLLKEVEEWAVGEYSVALLRGSALSPEDEKKIAGKMSEYTGLPVDYILDLRLRVNRDRYLKQLMRDESLVLGPYDARMKAHDVDKGAENILTDPSMFNVFGPCIATLNHYISKELDYENELPYRPLSRDVNKLWNWQSGVPGGMGYIDITDKLSHTMSYNPYIKVFLANGYYDLCTPYFLNRHTVDHLPLSRELLGNITFKCYEGGHMMYVHRDSRIRLRNDLREFYKKA